MGFMSLLFFAMWGGACYGLWKLLHLPSKPIEHLICSLYRSTYPPHPEDWVITHKIRVFRALLWLLLGMSSLAACFGLVGVVAAVGLLFVH